MQTNLPDDTTYLSFVLLITLSMNADCALLVRVTSHKIEDVNSRVVSCQTDDDQIKRIRLFIPKTAIFDEASLCSVVYHCFPKGTALHIKCKIKQSM